MTVCMLIMVLLVACTPEDQASLQGVAQDGSIRVDFIDVGQGDSSLIRLPNQQTILIDGGPRSSSEKLISFLDKEGLETIDYLIATHPHEDHIGGLPDVLDKYKVKNVYLPERTANTKIFEKLLGKIQENNLKINLASSGNIILDEDGILVEFLGPVKNTYENTNDHSIVTKITYKDNSFLIMGDAEKISEGDILKNGYNVKADVLRVGHHGSSTSSTKEFVEAVGANYYIISLGKDNSYGHPHREVVDILNRTGKSVYRTDLEGDISMVGDGNSIEVLSSKEDSNPEVKDTSVDKIEDLYIGNKNTEVFHTEDCTKLPSEKNRVVLKSKMDAKSQGYRPHTCVK